MFHNIISKWLISFDEFIEILSYKNRHDRRVHALKLVKAGYAQKGYKIKGKLTPYCRGMSLNRVDNSRFSEKINTDSVSGKCVFEDPKVKELNYKLESKISVADTTRNSIGSLLTKFKRNTQAFFKKNQRKKSKLSSHPKLSMPKAWTGLEKLEERVLLSATPFDDKPDDDTSNNLVVTYAPQLEKKISETIESSSPGLLENIEAQKIVLSSKDDSLFIDDILIYAEDSDQNMLNFENGLSVEGEARIDVGEISETRVFNNSGLLVTADTDVREYSRLDSAVTSQLIDIAIIDLAVEGYESLLADLADGTVSFVLNSEQDGLDQISNILATYKNVNSLHLFSHGSAGQLQLGNTILNSDNMAEYSNELADWASSFTQNADILLYGCNVAGDQAGIDFIQDIAEFTGADVAASDDLTGADELGGDWDLEQSTGLIESDVVAADGHQAVLDGIVGSSEADTLILATAFNYGGSVDGLDDTDTLDFSSESEDLTIVVTDSGFSVEEGINIVTAVNVEIVNSGSGADSADFSAVTTALTLNVAADGSTTFSGASALQSVTGVETFNGGENAADILNISADIGINTLSFNGDVISFNGTSIDLTSIENFNFLGHADSSDLLIEGIESITFNSSTTLTINGHTVTLDAQVNKPTLKSAAAALTINSDTDDDFLTVLATSVTLNSNQAIDTTLTTSLNYDGGSSASLTITDNSSTSITVTGNSVMLGSKTIGLSNIISLKATGLTLTLVGGTGDDAVSFTDGKVQLNEDISIQGFIGNAIYDGSAGGSVSLASTSITLNNGFISDGTNTLALVSGSQIKTVEGTTLYLVGDTSANEITLNETGTAHFGTTVLDLSAITELSLAGGMDLKMIGVAGDNRLETSQVGPSLTFAGVLLTPANDINIEFTGVEGSELTMIGDSELMLSGDNITSNGLNISTTGVELLTTETPGSLLINGNESSATISADGQTLLIADGLKVSTNNVTGISFDNLDDTDELILATDGGSNTLSLSEDGRSLTYGGKVFNLVGIELITFNTSAGSNVELQGSGGEDTLTVASDGKNIIYNGIDISFGNVANLSYDGKGTSNLTILDVVNLQFNGTAIILDNTVLTSITIKNTEIRSESVRDLILSGTGTTNAQELNFDENGSLTFLSQVMNLEGLTAISFKAETVSNLSLYSANTETLFDVSNDGNTIVLDGIQITIEEESTAFIDTLEQQTILYDANETLNTIFLSSSSGISTLTTGGNATDRVTFNSDSTLRIENLSKYEVVAPGKFTTGTSRIQALLKSLLTLEELSGRIPLAAESFYELLDIDSLPLSPESDLGFTANTLEEIMDLFNDWNTVDNGLSFTNSAGNAFDTDSITFNIVNGVVEYLFDIKMSATWETNVTIDTDPTSSVSSISDIYQESGLIINNTGSSYYKAVASFNFDAQLDFGYLFTADIDLFNANISTEDTALYGTLSGQVGLLETNVVSGTVDLSLDIVNDIAEGRRELNEFDEISDWTDLVNIANQTSSSSFSADLNIVPVSGPVEFTDTAVIHLGHNNIGILEYPSGVLPLTFSDNINGFRQINQATLVEGLTSYANWLTELESKQYFDNTLHADDSGVTGNTLPLSDAVRLEQLVDYGALLKETVIDKLASVSGQETIYTFGTIQDLVNHIPGLVVSYRETEGQLVFDVDFSQDLDTQLTAFVEDQSYGKLNKIDVLTNRLRAVTSPEGTGANKFILSDPENPDAKATLLFSLNGVSLAPVVISTSVTSTNTDISDLISDIQSALIAADIDDKIIIDSVDGRLVVTSADENDYISLNFTPGDIAEHLGFVNGADSVVEIDVKATLDASFIVSTQANGFTGITAKDSFVALTKDVSFSIFVDNGASVETHGFTLEKPDFPFPTGADYVAALNALLQADSAFDSRVKFELSGEYLKLSITDLDIKSVAMTIDTLYDVDSSEYTSVLGFTNGANQSQNIIAESWIEEGSNIATDIEMRWQEDRVVADMGFVDYFSRDAVAQSFVSHKSSFNSDRNISALNTDENSLAAYLDRPVISKNLSDLPSESLLTGITNPDANQQFLLNLSGVALGSIPTDLDAKLEFTAHKEALFNPGNSVITTRANNVDEPSVMDKLSAVDVIDALKSAGEWLRTTRLDSLLKSDLPVIGMNGNTINNFQEVLDDIIADISGQEFLSFDQMVIYINQALGASLPDNSSPGVSLDDSLSVDENLGLTKTGVSFDFEGDVLKMNLYLINNDSREFDLNLNVFDLVSLAGNIPSNLNSQTINILPINTDGVLDVKSQAVIDLDFEFDYSQADLVTTLKDTSQVAVNFNVDQLDIDSEVLIGTTSAYIIDGRVVYDNGSGGDAQYIVDVNTNLNLSSDSENHSASYTTDLVGKGEVLLPLYTLNSVNAPFSISEKNSSTVSALHFSIDSLKDLAQKSENSVVLENSGTVPDLASVSELPIDKILREPDLLINGLDRVFSLMQDSIAEPFSKFSGVPLIGDDIMDGIQPVLDQLEDIKAELAISMESVYQAAVIEAGEGADKMAIMRAILFDTFNNMTDSNGSRLLQDLTGGGVSIDDILINSQDGVFVEFDFNLGGKVEVDIPFDLGFDLASIIPCFDFQVGTDKNVHFEIDWDLNFAFGINNTDLFYINTNQTRDIGGGILESVPEILLSASLDIDGFDTSIDLGVLAGGVSDGFKPAAEIEGDSAITLLEEFNGSITIDTDKSGPVTYSTDGNSLNLIEFVVDFNAKMFSMSNGFVITPDFSNIQANLSSPQDSSFKFKITSTNPDVDRITITNSTDNFGFTNGQNTNRPSADDITNVTLTFSTDIVSENGEDRLSIGRISKNSFVSKLDFIAEANFAVNTEPGSLISGSPFDALGLPGIDFDLHTEFTASYDSTNPTGFEYNKGDLELHNIQVDAAQLIDNIVKPLISGIQDVISPFTSVLGDIFNAGESFLDQEIPGLSDLSKYIGQLPSTIGDLLPASSKEALDLFIDALEALDSLIGSIADVDIDNNSGVLNLGTWSLVMNEKEFAYFPKLKAPLPKVIVDTYRNIGLDLTNAPNPNMDIGFGLGLDLSNIGIPAFPLPSLDLPSIDLPSLPDFELPKITLPDLELPNIGDLTIDLPSIDLSGFELEIQLPDLDLPVIDLGHLDLGSLNLGTISLPDIDLSEWGLGIISLPNIDLGEIDLPTIYLGTLDLPTIPLPSISLPDIGFPPGIPTLHLPSINFPEIDLGSIVLPSITLPDLNLPSINLPSVNGINLPPINLPTIHLGNINLGSLQLPVLNLSSIDLPSIPIPDLNLPTWDLPIINIGNISLGSISLPELSLPSINLPTIKLPSIDLEFPGFNMDFNLPDFDFDFGFDFGAFKDIFDAMGVSANADLDVSFAPSGYKLDFLNMENIFSMIICGGGEGDPFDIVSYNLPELDLDLSLDAGFGFGARGKSLGFDIGGGGSIHLDPIGIVYDSTGIQRIAQAVEAGLEPDYDDMLDGFYLRTFEGAEFEIDFNFGGSAGVDFRIPAFCISIFGAEVCTPEFIIFAMEAGLDISAFASLDITDPNSDGKLRLDELMNLTNNFANPENILNMFSAELGAEASAYLRGTIANQSAGVSLNVEIGADFNFGDLFGLNKPSSQPSTTPVLGEVSDGVLRINSGQFDYARLHGGSNDSGGDRVIVSGVNGRIVITHGSDSQTITSNVETIVYRGGSGNDYVDMRGVSGVVLDIEGGAGNDIIFGGSANDFISGGLGRDTIDGGGGDDTILGDGGNDILKGGSGFDIMIGGLGNDSLDGGSGEDKYLYGSTAAEKNGWGNDTVSDSGGAPTNLLKRVVAIDAIQEGSVEFVAKNHGYVVGQTITGVSITGVAGISKFNVTRNITVLDKDTFRIEGAVFENGYEPKISQGQMIINGGTRINPLPSANDAAYLHYYTDNIDMSNVSDNMFFNLTHSGATVTIGDEFSNANKITLSNQNVETYIGGSGNDKYNIKGSNANYTVLKGGEGSDDYVIHDTPFINGDIFILDEASRPAVDRLLVEGSSGNDSIAMSDERIRLTNGKLIQYAPEKADTGLERIVYNLHEGSDLLEVASVAASTAVIIDTGDQNDTVQLGVTFGNNNNLTSKIIDSSGTAQGTLNLIRGAIESGQIQLSTGLGNDSLELYDNTEVINDSVVLGLNTITGLGMAQGVKFRNLENVRIELGAGNDTVYTKVEGDKDSRSSEDIIYNAIISGNAGDDKINIDEFHGDLTISGGKGEDFIEVKNYKGLSTISGDEGDDLIELYDIHNANVSGGADNDEIRLRKNTGTVSIQGNSGADDIEIGTQANELDTSSPKSGTLNEIKGVVTVDGGGDVNDVLLIDDSAETEVNTGWLTNNQLRGLGMTNNGDIIADVNENDGVINYSGIDIFDLYLGQNDDRLFVASTHDTNTRITGNSGSDAIIAETMSGNNDIWGDNKDNTDSDGADHIYVGTIDGNKTVIRGNQMNDIVDINTIAVSMTAKKSSGMFENALENEVGGVYVIGGTGTLNARFENVGSNLVVTTSSSEVKRDIIVVDSANATTVIETYKGDDDIYLKANTAYVSLDAGRGSDFVKLGAEAPDEWQQYLLDLKTADTDHALLEAVRIVTELRHVQNSGSLSGIKANINILSGNQGENDILEINDDAGMVDRDMVLEDDRFTIVHDVNALDSDVGNKPRITYETFDYLNIFMSSNDDHIDIASTFHLTDNYIFGDQGNDTFSFGSKTDLIGDEKYRVTADSEDGDARMDYINGHVRVEGNAGYNKRTFGAAGDLSLQRSVVDTDPEEFNMNIEDTTANSPAEDSEKTTWTHTGFDVINIDDSGVEANLGSGVDELVSETNKGRISNTQIDGFGIGSTDSKLNSANPKQMINYYDFDMMNINLGVENEDLSVVGVFETGVDGDDAAIADLPVGDDANAPQQRALFVNANAGDDIINLGITNSDDLAGMPATDLSKLPDVDHPEGEESRIGMNALHGSAYINGGAGTFDTVNLFDRTDVNDNTDVRYLDSAGYEQIIDARSLATILHTANGHITGLDNQLRTDDFNQNVAHKNLEELNVFLGTADDIVHIETSDTTELHTDVDNDHERRSSQGPGEDRGQDNTNFYGGSGDDSFIMHNDQYLRGSIDGEAGLGDRIDYHLWESSVLVNLKSGKATGLNSGYDTGLALENRDDSISYSNENGVPQSSIEYVIGGEGDDFLYGSDLNNVIIGNGGNDSIYGFAGSDRLIGDYDDNYIRYSERNDAADLTSAEDLTTAKRNSGDDLIVAGSGNDDINGGLGSDDLRGGEGNDVYRLYDNPYEKNLVESGTHLEGTGEFDADNIEIMEEITDYSLEYRALDKDILRDNSGIDMLDFSMWNVYDAMWDNTTDLIQQKDADGELMFDAETEEPIMIEVTRIYQPESESQLKLYDEDEQALNTYKEYLDPDTQEWVYFNRGINLDLAQSGQVMNAKTGQEIVLEGSFEHVIATDGIDKIYGNSADNIIITRGEADIVDGRAGDDTIDVGGDKTAGKDYVNSGSGADTVYGLKEVEEQVYGNDGEKVLDNDGQDLKRIVVEDTIIASENGTDADTVSDSETDQWSWFTPGGQDVDMVATYQPAWTNSWFGAESEVFENIKQYMPQWQDTVAKTPLQDLGINIGTEDDFDFNTDEWNTVLTDMETEISNFPVTVFNGTKTTSYSYTSVEDNSNIYIYQDGDAIVLIDISLNYNYVVGTDGDLLRDGDGDLITESETVVNAITKVRSTNQLTVTGGNEAGTVYVIDDLEGTDLEKITINLVSNLKPDTQIDYVNTDNIHSDIVVSISGTSVTNGALMDSATTALQALIDSSTALITAVDVEDVTAENHLIKYTYTVKQPNSNLYIHTLPELDENGENFIEIIEIANIEIFKGETPVESIWEQQVQGVSKLSNLEFLEISGGAEENIIKIDSLAGTQIEKIKVELKTGDDLLNASALAKNISMEVYGDAGKDRIVTGAGSDIVDAGSGDDIVRVNAGNNLVDAGSGFDLIDADTEFDHVINNGYDSADLETDTDGESNTILAYSDSDDSALLDKLADYGHQTDTDDRLDALELAKVDLESKNNDGDAKQNVLDEAEAALLKATSDYNYASAFYDTAALIGNDEYSEMRDNDGNLVTHFIYNAAESSYNTALAVRNTAQSELDNALTAVDAAQTVFDDVNTALYEFNVDDFRTEEAVATQITRLMTIESDFKSAETAYQDALKNDTMTSGIQTAYNEALTLYNSASGDFKEYAVTEKVYTGQAANSSIYVYEQNGAIFIVDFSYTLDPVTYGNNYEQQDVNGDPVVVDGEVQYYEAGTVQKTDADGLLIVDDEEQPVYYELGEAVLDADGEQLKYRAYQLNGITKYIGTSKLTINTGSQDNVVRIGDVSNTVMEELIINTGNNDDDIVDINAVINNKLGEAVDITVNGTEKDELESLLVYNGEETDPTGFADEMMALISSGGELKFDVDSAFTNGEIDTPVLTFTYSAKQPNSKIYVEKNGFDILIYDVALVELTPELDEFGNVVKDEFAKTQFEKVAELDENDEVVRDEDNNIIYKKYEVVQQIIRISGYTSLTLNTGSAESVVRINDLDDTGIETIALNLGSGDDILDAQDISNKIKLTITGGAGDDLILAGAGADTIDAGTGDDLVFGRAGDDQIKGNSGDDLIFAMTGDDTVYGGHDNDIIYGNEGRDTIYGESGSDIIFGGTGNDTIYAGDHNDLVFGNDGIDEIYGDDGHDTLAGGDGDDRIVGGMGDDILYGDTPFSGIHEGSVADADTGNDILFGDGLVTFNVDSDGFLNKNIDGTWDYELIDAGVGGDDILIGNGGNDLLDGNRGNDILFGDNAIVLSNDDDGDSYRDYLAIDDQALPYTMEADGNDILFGNQGNDRLYGSFGFDLLDGGVDDDYMDGGTGGDLIRAVADRNTVIGWQGDDQLYGYNQHVRIYGGFGNDGAYIDVQNLAQVDLGTAEKGDVKGLVTDYNTANQLPIFTIKLEQITDLEQYDQIGQDNQLQAQKYIVDWGDGTATIVDVENPAESGEFTWINGAWEKFDGESGADFGFITHRYQSHGENVGNIKVSVITIADPASQTIDLGHALTVAANIDPSVETGFIPNRINVTETMDLTSKAHDIGINKSLTYEWHMGDGSIVHGFNVSYRYSQPGSYQIELRVIDSDGGVISRFFGITVYKDLVVPDMTIPELSYKLPTVVSTDLKPADSYIRYQVDQRVPGINNNSGAASSIKSVSQNGTYIQPKLIDFDVIKLSAGEVDRDFLNLFETSDERNAVRAQEINDFIFNQEEERAEINDLQDNLRNPRGETGESTGVILEELIGDDLKDPDERENELIEGPGEVDETGEDTGGFQPDDTNEQKEKADQKNSNLSFNNRMKQTFQSVLNRLGKSTIMKL